MPDPPDVMRKAEKEIGDNIPEEMKGLDSEDYHHGDEEFAPPIKKKRRQT